ncbi:DsbA family oxidoreductase [Maricaulis sp. CAU 1757]
MTHSVSVDLIADFVCPWCWLGKRHWDQALQSAPRAKIETLWRPFQLDPTLPREGVPYQAYMEKKFAGEDAGRWRQMRDHLEQAGPTIGITFNFDKLEIRPNTLNAHRVMRWARGQGQADDLAEYLFKAFFEDGLDIGDTETLTSLAGQAGLDPDTVRDLLSTDRDEKPVWEEELFYRKLGVSGVPTYIFNGRFAVSGAQDTSVLVDAIRQAAKEPAEAD